MCAISSGGSFCENAGLVRMVSIATARIPLRQRLRLPKFLVKGDVECSSKGARLRVAASFMSA
jgi:hypothetical protein